jgi:hypothetical protein
MSRNITFDYSLDGTTFTGAAITVKCNVVHAYLMPEEVQPPTRENGGDYLECQTNIQRIHVAIEISSRDLNPANSATALANFIFLQKWQCAPVRRIYNADVATDAKIDGWDTFDVSTNTNYINIDQPNAPEFEDMRIKGTRDIRTMTINGYTRKKVSL